MQSIKNRRNVALNHYVIYVFAFGLHNMRPLPPRFSSKLTVKHYKYSQCTKFQLEVFKNNTESIQSYGLPRMHGQKFGAVDTEVK